MILVETLTDNFSDARELRLRSLLDSPDAFTSTYEKESKYTDQDWDKWFKNSQWFLAYLNHEPAGVACLIQPQGFAVDKRELVSMWVTPEARGTGVSKEIINSVIDWCRNNSVTCVELSVITGNVPALKLYEHFGFEITRSQIDVGDSSNRSYDVLALDTNQVNR